MTLAVPLRLGADGSLELLGGKAIGPSSNISRGTYLAKIYDARLDGTVAVVDERFAVNDSEPSCCLTGQATVRWRWTGSGFAPICTT